MSLHIEYLDAKKIVPSTKTQFASRISSENILRQILTL